MTSPSLYLLLALLVCAPPADAQANILILVADDMGVDMLPCYGEGQDLPNTPTIDGLAANGIRFRNCWSNPVCSPTRASLQTGRYSFRTGIGHVVDGTGSALQHSELILPEVLALQSNASWDCAAIGKWHLGNPTDPTHPNLAGYAHFTGSLHNLKVPGHYYNWTKVTNGLTTTSTTYATTDTVDEALAWIATASEPWMCYVAFNAPHGPFHEPPAELHNVDLPDVDPRLMPRPFYKATIEALDSEMGRLLNGINQTSGPTNIVFFGDNGTPREVPVPPFTPEHAKFSVYEGGLNVPLILNGPAVQQPGSWCEGLVNTTDLFATVLDLANADLPAALLPADSVSLEPYLTTPQMRSLRSYVYAEIFRPNGPPPFHGRRRAIRGPRYKLIRREPGSASDELYDLRHDRFEESDLLDGGQPLPPGQVTALERLRSQLDRL